MAAGDVMMAWGTFCFSIDTLAYQDLKRRTAWRHAATPRNGVREASQYVGPGPETFDLSGWFAPALKGSPASLRELRAQGDTGLAYPLVSGVGEVFGAYKIENLDEDQAEFFSDGAARRIAFAASFIRVADEDAADPRAADGGQAASGQSGSGQATPAVESAKALAEAFFNSGGATEADIAAGNRAAGGSA